jgi:Zn-dependent protease with chaperone function
MKIVNRTPRRTADVSSAKGSTLSEFAKMVLAAVVLLVIIYIVVGLVTDFTVSRLSYESESRLFTNFIPQLPGPVAEDAAGDLKQANAVLALLREDAEVPPLPFKLQLIESDDPNAFAIPGGTIAVTRGLLNLLDEDIEFAFVIGHEIGHFRNRDHLKGMGRAVGFGVISAIIFGGTPETASFRNLADFIFQRTYSQDREELADRYGLELVHRTYGKVEGSERLFQLIQEEDVLPRWTYMFATHPSPEERIVKLMKHAETL